MTDLCLVKQAVKAFNGDYRTIKPLGGLHNNVYSYVTDNKENVIKIYDATKSPKHHIQGEVEWVKHLYDNELNVTGPIISIRGNYVEELTYNLEKYNIISYEKALGRTVDASNKNEWNDSLFEKWGKALGKMHKVTKTYKESDPLIKRNEWNGNKIYKDQYPTIDKTIINKWKTHIDIQNKFNKEKSSYGLIHNDLHQQNFHINNDELIILDFDGCQYHWFVNDIAIAIYHAVQDIPLIDKGKRTEFGLRFTDALLKGYFSENNLDDWWINNLPYFINFRLTYSYMYFVHHLDMDKLGDKYKEALDKMKGYIKNDIEYLDISKMFK